LEFLISVRKEAFLAHVSHYATKRKGVGSLFITVWGGPANSTVVSRLAVPDILNQFLTSADARANGMYA